MELNAEKWATMTDEEILIDFTTQMYSKGFYTGAIICGFGLVCGYTVATLVVNHWDSIKAIGPKIKSKLKKKEGS